MTSFTRQWNTAYEGLPPQSESARVGASRIRNLKVDIRERLAVDHRIAGDAKDGEHLKVTLRAVSDPPTDSTAGYLYAKLQGGVVELYFKDSAGTVFPLTSAAGGLSNILLPGFIMPVGNAVDADGISWIQCDGRAVSRTTYAGLFFAIGTIWGGGDGVTTFNVPDLRGRTVIGRGTGTGLSARSTGQIVGAEKHRLTIQEIPGHQHTVYGNNTTNTAGSVFGAVQNSANNSSFLTESAGGDPGTGIANEHENMQPSAVVNWWIKT